MNVQVIDIILGVPILYGAVKGFQKGVIHELSGLVALFLGLYISIKFSDFTGSLIVEHTEIEGKFVPALAYALTFVATCFGVLTVGKVLSKMAKVVLLGTINKFAGAVFGGLKTLLIIAGLILLVEGFDQDFNFIPYTLKDESLLYHPLKETAGMVVPAVKESDLFKDALQVIHSL